MSAALQLGLRRSRRTRMLCGNALRADWDRILGRCECQGQAGKSRVGEQFEWFAGEHAEA
jgi:hypothetical protein